MRMSIALLSLVISVYSAGAQDNSVLTYHGDAGRSGNFVVPALTWEKARSLNLDRAFRSAGCRKKRPSTVHQGDPCQWLHALAHPRIATASAQSPAPPQPRRRAFRVVYNILNPSAATELPPNYPAQDYRRLFDHTKQAGVGVIGIRVLAGGALSGSSERHPIASPPPEPIGSAMSYEADVARARRLMPIVQEGFAANAKWLAESAILYISQQKLTRIAPEAV